MSNIVCVPKSLTPSQAAIAVRRGIEINPAGAATIHSVERTEIGRRGGPRRLALLIESRWPATGVRLPVEFLDNPSKELRARILLHMNAWSKFANIRFEETRKGGLVRISRLNSPPDLAGYWSYVGTQILGIEDDDPTLNLEGFTMRTSEAEFKRVVRHEAGHTLGFEHEHMRSDLVKKIDRRKAIAYFDRECGWTEEETIDQVLTPLAKKTITGTTESDPLSIMCYEIPAAITKDGKVIRGGKDINRNDYRFAAGIYPKPKSRQDSSPPPLPPAPPSTTMEDPPSPPPPATPIVNASEPLECSSSDDKDTLHIVIMDEFNPEGEAKAKGRGGVASSLDEAGPRFARVFASYCGARVTNAMRIRSAPGEDATSYGRIINTHERIKNYTNFEHGSLPSDEEMLKFGGDLFQTLFEGDVRRLYDEARARQQNRKLDIVFTSMIPWIAEKPWEFAYDVGRESFLATEEIHLVRNVLTAVPAAAIRPRSGPLRILVASAQPVGYGRLSIDQEVDVIRRGFLPLIDAGLVTVKVLAHAKPREVLGWLATGNFTVLHFIGHGKFDEINERGAIFFEDETGDGIAISERSIREIFCKRGVNLVFLNACQSGSGGKLDFNNGIAQSLVAHGLPAVVANQYSVLDVSATSFAQHFYWSLAHGLSIGQAACDARIAVNCSMQGEPIDWAVPVVYARNPNMTICTKPAQISPPVAAVRPKSRSDLQSRSKRIGVWDIDNVFPSLDQTLESMNGVQSTFGFEVVSLSVPVDAWDKENPSPDGTPYLWAEKLAKRLGRMASELGVHVLACITRHWLTDDHYVNLYGWWPDEKKPPVVIFSCAGFDDLPAEGKQTDIAIANLMVSGLAGFFGESGSHDRGSKRCPLSFNLDRKFSHLIGRQAFDSHCRAKLKKKIPKELPALEALLKTFN